MTKIFPVILALFISSLALAGRERTGGGGYLLGKSETITFAQTFNIFIGLGAGDEVFEGLKNDKPELREALLLAQIIRGIPNLDPEVKAKTLEAILPGKRRTYLALDELSQSEQVKIGRVFNELFEATPMQTAISELLFYETSLHVQPIILALTDSDVGTTYLADEFFKVKDSLARMALIFHESLWVLNPDLDYRSIVRAETAFYHYLLRLHDEDSLSIPKESEVLSNFLEDFISFNKKDREAAVDTTLGKQLRQRP